jgi:hypothetical protein
VLAVVEQQALFIELLSKNAVLFAQVVNHLQLALVNPPRDGDQHEPKRIQGSRHL